jgi:hypothetical protein
MARFGSTDVAELEHRRSSPVDWVSFDMMGRRQIDQPFVAANGTGRYCRDPGRRPR